MIFIIKNIIKALLKLRLVGVAKFIGVVRWKKKRDI